MAGFALKVKSKTGQQILRSLTKESTIYDLKSTLSSLSNIPTNKLHVLYGFPPRILDISHDSLTLASSGISTGETLILEEKQTAASEKSGPASPKKVRLEENVEVHSIEARSHTLDDFPNSDVPGILMKKVVPADNSCLFTSIHFVLSGKVDESGTAAPIMRELVAETVQRESDEFSEALLGKPNSEYVRWIKDDKSWGGAIEISILSNHYGIEIAVVDTVNAIINKFGEDQEYAHRVFLMFDGIHYDPLYMEPLNGGGIQTIFPREDERLLQEAQELAREAKSSRQYTDVNKFTLKCMVCNIHLSGQKEAQLHATSTGHANFGEIVDEHSLID